MNQHTNIDNPLEQLERLRNKIHAASRYFGRDLDSVAWVAVSKGQPFSAIESFNKAGQHVFAENYVQEALPKIQQAKSLDLHLDWHFIGRLQSNKLQAIAHHFDWVQTLDSLAHARRLNQIRPQTLPPLNCCIQISIKEPKPLTAVELQSKCIKVTELAVAITQFKQLSLRGVMCMIPPLSEFDQQRRCFAICREVYEHLKQNFPFLDTLSMGMSGDFEAAIAEGATLLRIGTALFGPRLTPTESPKSSTKNKSSMKSAIKSSTESSTKSIDGLNFNEKGSMP